MVGRAGLLLAALLLVAFAPAHAVIGDCPQCYNTWELTWIVATFGPICICDSGNATVVFSWSGSEDHGIFQIPTDACPEGGFGGFATPEFKELTPASKVGRYEWQVPSEVGDYWVTSQAGSDCLNGMKAQIRVVSGSSALRVAWQTLAAAAALALALVGL